MKYVIFKHKSGAMMPVIIPEHVTHSTVTIEDAVPFSAGYFVTNTITGVKVFGKSESLNLEPHPVDVRLINATLDNCGMYAFI